MTVLLFTASRDWETVKNVVLFNETLHRNRINLTAREKVLNSHQILNHSDMLFILSRRYTLAAKARQR